MDSACLVVDLGTGSLRVSLVSEFGKILSTLKNDLVYIRKGSAVEFRLEKLYEEVIRMIRKTVAAKPVNIDILGISVTSQRNGCVFYDAGMKEIFGCPNIDGRVSTDLVERMFRYGRKIYEETGRWVYGNSPAMRLLWMMENHPDIYDKIKFVSMLNDWLAFRLTNNIFSEHTNAAETMLYNITDRSWSETLKQLFRTEAVTTPPLVDPGSIVGYLIPACADECGLDNELPVFLGPADTQCAMIGSGVMKPGEIAVVNGSTTPVIMVTKEPVFDRFFRTWTDIYVDGLCALESNCRRSGIVYKKLLSDFNEILDTVGAHVQLDPRDIESLFHRFHQNTATYLFMGSSLCDFSKNDVFKNVLYHDFQEYSVFTHIFSAAIENIAFSVIANIHQLRDITCIGPARIVLTGGGSDSAYFRWIVSNVLSECEVVHTVQQETTSIGAALSAFAANGGFSGTLHEYSKRCAVYSSIKKDDTKSGRLVRDRFLGWMSIMEKHNTRGEKHEAAYTE